MKKLPLIISFLLAATAGVVGCDSDDNDTVVPVIEPENGNPNHGEEPEDTAGIVTLVSINDSVCYDTITYVQYSIDAKTNTAKVRAGYEVITGEGNMERQIEHRPGSFLAKGDIDILDRFYIDGKLMRVTAIGEWAFFACGEITSVTIPEGITEIGTCTFAACTSLKKVVIPESVKTIGNSAFYGCRLLKEVSLPDKLEKIDVSAFYISGLKSITIPATVTEIGRFALYTDSLKSIYSNIKDPFETQAFRGPKYMEVGEQFNNATLYVPKGCKEKYQDTMDWCLFKNIVEME